MKIPPTHTLHTRKPPYYIVILELRQNLGPDTASIWHQASDNNQIWLGRYRLGGRLVINFCGVLNVSDGVANELRKLRGEMIYWGSQVVLAEVGEELASFLRDSVRNLSCHNFMEAFLVYPDALAALYTLKHARP